MATIPGSVADFLACKRIAVAGVSRNAQQTGNAIFRKLRESGYDAVPVNPNATELEGTRCYPDIASIPGKVGAVMVVTPPGAALDLVRQSQRCGVRHIWFHRSFGDGSVSEQAVREALALGMNCIVGGCPFMYCEPVDPFHKIMRTWLGWRHRVPTV